MNHEYEKFEMPRERPSSAACPLLFKKKATVSRVAQPNNAITPCQAGE